MSAPVSVAEAPGHPVVGRPPRLSRLVLGALGVVYGDIGTSPLYAVKECFSGGYGLIPTHENVLGVLSLVFWALFMVIVVSTTFIMRATIAARAARAARACGRPAASRRW
jgi:KUP system potassium uptake protein